MKTKLGKKQKLVCNCSKHTAAPNWYFRILVQDYVDASLIIIRKVLSCENNDSVYNIVFDGCLRFDFWICHTLQPCYSIVMPCDYAWGLPLFWNLRLSCKCWFMFLNQALKNFLFFAGSRCRRELRVYKRCCVQETWCFNASIPYLLCHRRRGQLRVKTNSCWSWRNRPIHGGRLI